MAKIVIAHQSAWGADEIYDAYVIGQALARRGHQVCYISDSVRGIYQLAGPGVRLEAWPVTLPLGLAEDPAARSPQFRGYGDKIAEMGFSDPVRLRTIINAWFSQLRRAKPDLIIAISAPIAWLIGPNITSTLAMGSGAAMPVSPDELSDAASAIEPNILETNANIVLDELGLKQIDALPDILRRCQQWHYGLDSLDPYLTHRQAPSVGILGAAPQDCGARNDNRLSIFLDVDYPYIDIVLFAIAERRKISIDLFVKGATIAMQNFLSAQPEITVWDRFDDAMAQVPRSGAIVHHGVPMLATLGVATGRAHLVLPWSDEQGTVLEMLKNLGVAWWKDSSFSVIEISEALREILNAKDTINQASHHAVKLAEEGTDNALLTINAVVEAAVVSRAAKSPSMSFATVN